MDVTHATGDEQATRWNGDAGKAWVDTQEVLDQVFRPFEDMLVDAVLQQSGRSVLDVGCGTGATTLAIARRLAGHGRCTGIDISEPMIEAARRRAEREGTPAAFIRAGAHDYPFPPDSFDLIVSRFGVMFFEDPIAAFAHLRRAAGSNAALNLIVWRSVEENPFMTTAERAAAPLLPSLPARPSNAPGQFAFANRDNDRHILHESGWSAIDIEPVDVDCAFPEPALVPYLTRLGPVGRALQDADDDLRTRVIGTARAAFDPYVHGSEVRFTAACWMLRARAGLAATHGRR